MSDISNQISAITKEFPEDISKLLNADRSFHFEILLKEISSSLNVKNKYVEEELDQMGTVLELVQATIDIHSKIALLPNSDINNKLSILGGDLLYSRALELIPNIQTKNVRELIFDKISKSTKAEVLLGMMAASGRFFGLNKYKKMAKLRSGSFPSLCFSVAAYHSQFDKKKRVLFEDIGFSLGLIRQMLLELNYFSKEEVNNYNTQQWYFAYLSLGKSKIKKASTSSEASEDKKIIEEDKKEDLIHKLKIVIAQQWLQHKKLINKLPSELTDPIQKTCETYIDDLNPGLWLSYA